MPACNIPPSDNDNHTNDALPATGASRIAALIGFFLLCGSVMAAGGWVTAGSVDTWYTTLEKPFFNPPDAVFGPVWAMLFALMAWSGWRVWCRCGLDRSFVAFGMQLALNLGWSTAFFGLQRPDIALLDLTALIAVLACNIVMFWQRDRLAGLLLLPYMAWICFAAALNIAIVWMN